MRARTTIEALLMASGHDRPVGIADGEPALDLLDETGGGAEMLDRLAVVTTLSPSIFTLNH